MLFSLTFKSGGQAGGGVYMEVDKSINDLKLVLAK
jgi:hypothetical protein